MSENRKPTPSRLRKEERYRQRVRKTLTRKGKYSPASKSRSGGIIPDQLTDKQRGQRLQKVLADAGVASRRECELLIAQGLVSVNGQMVTALPAWVDPEKDVIMVNEKRVQPASSSTPSKKGPSDRVWIMLNKPRGVISTAHDPQGRKSVTEMVDLPTPPGRHAPPRLFPVGRLDADSTGLILLTNDGDLAHRLTHPKYEVAKQYNVSVQGRLADSALVDLREGIYLAHLKDGNRRGMDQDVRLKRAAMTKVELIGYSRERSKQGERTRLAVTLHEGQNREIRRMLASLGHKVRRLERVGIGPLKLKGLGPGQWRMLTGKEKAMLEKTAGL